MHCELTFTFLHYLHVKLSSSIDARQQQLRLRKPKCEFLTNDGRPFEIQRAVSRGSVFRQPDARTTWLSSRTRGFSYFTHGRYQFVG